jgi:X-linked retinitis pigmentosa GTPase regulator
MINELLSRPNIQEFLNKYPSSRWKELITDLFEIGILNLRNSFNRDEFSRKQFIRIINDLENPSPAPIAPLNYNSFQSPQQYENYQNQKSNYSYPQKSSTFTSQKIYNKKYLDDNLKSYYDGYDFKRRKRRIKKLESRETPAKMDAFYSPKNETPMTSDLKIKKRSHWEIMNKILMSRQKRDRDRNEIKQMKEIYKEKWREHLEKKRLERMRERKAEEDIKEEEREKRRIKEDEDYQEGYYEDHQEEDEIEEEEETDKYNDYNRGYDDEEEEEEEGEEGEEGEVEGEGEEGMEEGAEEEHN